MVAEGNAAPSDYSRMMQFWNRFTPAFYPGRYALKDDMYSQYPLVLDALLLHVLDRYQLAGVGYVEFSVGFGDLVSRPWIFKHLINPQLPNSISAFVPAYNGRVTFRYLIGFSRFFPTLHEALILADGHHVGAIARNVASKYDSEEAKEWFRPHIDQLGELKAALAASRGAYPDYGGVGLHAWCVGLDYMSDEYQHPHCPFALVQFTNFLNTERKERPGAHFGFRYHCGEFDVVHETPLFLAHMGASAVVIGRILDACAVNAGEPPVLRIGHGTGFRHFLALGDFHQYALDQAFERYHIARALHLMKKNHIPIEVNLTSNHYLLGDAPSTELLKQLIDHKMIIVLATDNDGIWRTERADPDGRIFYSVAGEFYGAITGMLTMADYKLTDSDVSALVSNYSMARFGATSESPRSSGQLGRYLKRSKTLSVATALLRVDAYSDSAYSNAQIAAASEIPSFSFIEEAIQRDDQLKHADGVRTWSKWIFAITKSIDNIRQSDIRNIVLFGKAPISLALFIGLEMKHIDNVSFVNRNEVDKRWEVWNIHCVASSSGGQRIFDQPIFEQLNQDDGKIVLFLSLDPARFYDSERTEQISEQLGASIGPTAERIAGIARLEHRSGRFGAQPDMCSQICSEFIEFIRRAEMTFPKHTGFVVASALPLPLNYLFGTHLNVQTHRSITFVENVNNAYQIAWTSLSSL